MTESKPNGGESQPLDPEVAAALTELRALETSVLLARYQFARQHGLTFDGERDEYAVLGYDRLITVQQYRDEYARGGIAGRIVDTPPNACWRGVVELIEDEDPDVITPFEQAWIDLDKRLGVQAKLHRVDKLSTLSTYAVLLIGAPGALDTELPKGSPEKLLYLRPALGGGGPANEAPQSRQTLGADATATIEEYEADPTNERFGLPKSYRLKWVEVASPALGVPVHWSRILHVAEGLLEDEVFGQPALERVWNLLADLRKVTGGGSEAFWLRANQGFHVDVDKDMSMNDPSLSLEKLKEQIQLYKHGLDRWIRTKGTNVDVLGSDVANFANPADAILTQIAGSKAIPKRILTGSEMGELASSQDRDNWQDQVNGRQTGHCEPNVLRPFVDRLVKHGYLPTPKNGPGQYQVRWSPISKLSPPEKNAIGSAWASINASMGEVVFTRDEIREAAADKGPLSPKQLAQIEDEKAARVKQQQELMKAQQPAQAPADEDQPFAEERAAGEGGRSTTQVQLPPTLARRVRAFAATIPDDALTAKGREDDVHITVRYGFETDDATEIATRAADFIGPITYTLGPLAVFSNPEHDVLYVTVDSPDLIKLNAIIGEFFDSGPTSGTTKYTPHATIAYLKPGLGASYAGDLALDGFSATANAITFVDRQDRRTVLPLGLRAAEADPDAALVEVLAAAIESGASDVILAICGGAGSGHWGHSGRPGEVGGSAPSDDGGGGGGTPEQRRLPMSGNKFERDRESGRARIRKEEADRPIKTSTHQGPISQEAARRRADALASERARADRLRGEEPRFENKPHFKDDVLKKGGADALDETPDGQVINSLEHPVRIDEDEVIVSDPLKPGEHANKVYEVETDSGSHFAFKSIQGEDWLRPAYIYNHDATLAEREVIARRVDKEMGLNMGTPTTMGKVGGLGDGVVIDWVDGLQEYYGDDREALARQGIYDAVIGNLDRHGGNVMADGDGNVRNMDHGYSFGVTPPGEYLRSVSLAGIEDGDLDIDEQRELSKRLSSFNYTKVLRGTHLSADEQESFRQRVNLVAERLAKGEAHLIKDDFAVSAW